MKISVEEIEPLQEEEILIRCHSISPKIESLVDQLKTNTATLVGYQEDEMYRIPLSDIYYFETVDGKVFAYTKDTVYEVKQKLYELEDMCAGTSCFRATKSTILNVNKIASVHSTFSGRFEVTLDNNERAVVSRQYVPILKSLIGLTGGAS